MIPLLDCSQHKVAEIAQRLNVSEYGQLCTPLTGYARIPGLKFGIDNGGFTTQDPAAFARTLKRLESDKADCKFVVMPDVPGDGRRTLELFHLFKSGLHGWPLAMAMQDGIEDLDIPWSDLSAIFMAGSGDWKMGTRATNIIKAAKWLGLWVHVGRISDPRRWKFFEGFVCDSADSSALVRPLPGRMDGLSKMFSGAVEPQQLTLEAIDGNEME